MTTTSTTGPLRTADAARRRMLIIGWVTVALGTLHFTDHAIRGAYVVHHGLDPAWNHSGWPFQPTFTPFAGSLIVVYGLLLTGIFLTFRRRVGAAYWLFTAIIIGSIVIAAHTLGATPETRCS